MNEIQKLYELVMSKIEKSNAFCQVQANKHKKRMVFQPRNVVLYPFKKGVFPT